VIIKKTNILFTSIAVILGILLSVTFIWNSRIRTFDYNDEKMTRTIVADIDYQSMLDTSFDSYILETKEERVSLDAEKSFSVTKEQIDNLGLDDSIEGNTVNVKYNIDYDSVNNLIYLTINFMDFDDIIESETLQGSVFYDENNKIDAVFNVDGEPVLMSEMANVDMVNNCGFFGKLFNAVKKVAKVVAVAATVVAVAAVVVSTAGVGAVAVAGVGASVGASVIAVGATTSAIAVTAATIAAVAVGVYVLADAITVTAEVLAELTRELERKNEAMYCPAFLVGSSLRIIPVPVKRSLCIEPIKMGQNFWTISSMWARDLAVAASGGATEMEVHKGIGYYCHYHLLGRVGGHSFFGTPVDGIYNK